MRVRINVTLVKLLHCREGKGVRSEVYKKAPSHRLGADYFAWRLVSFNALPLTPHPS